MTRQSQCMVKAFYPYINQSTCGRLLIKCGKGGAITRGLDTKPHFFSFFETREQRRTVEDGVRVSSVGCFSLGLAHRNKAKFCLAVRNVFALPFNSAQTHWKASNCIENIFFFGFRLLSQAMPTIRFYFTYDEWRGHHQMGCLVH